MRERYTVSEASAILGVPAGAPLPVVRRAFRRLALKHHPDRNPGDPGAAERFLAVTEAYRTLRTPRTPPPASPPTDPFAPQPRPEHAPGVHENERKMYYPTAAEIAALDRPRPFRPTKWLGLLCGLLIFGAILDAYLLDREGVSIGPGKPWVQQFLRLTSRRIP